MALGTTLTVDLSDLHHVESRPSTLSDDSTPPPGSVLLAVDRFGFSANNVSYLAHGAHLGLWSLFPAPDGFGSIPAWGHLRVLRSEHPAVAAGSTFYGLAPMSTNLLVAPTDAGARGFTDGSPHRSTGAAVYNRYLDRRTDPVASESPSPDLEVLLRPLFTAAFLLDAHLEEHHWFAADAVVVTSASSRTALALAHLLHRRGRRPAVIGLTSPGHLDDVRSTGSWDRVLGYDDAGSLPVGPTVLVDFSGDATVVAGLHRHLDDALVHSTAVGATHRQAPPVGPGQLPGTPRTIFLAPATAAALRERHGDEAVEQLLSAAWGPFAAAMQDWLHLRRVTDEVGLRQVYDAGLDGTLSPRDAWVCSLRPEPT